MIILKRISWLIQDGLIKLWIQVKMEYKKRLSMSKKQ